MNDHDQSNRRHRTFIREKCGELDALIRRFMELRDKGFWSFRGQRKQQWPLGPHQLDEGNIPRAQNCVKLQMRMKNFKKRCMEFPQPDYLDENNEWRWMFYAQHHGLHTQLLDWTSNPLVALYFAVENIISKGDDVKDFGAVWCLKVDGSRFIIPDDFGQKPAEVDRWLMINPAPVTSRLGLQSGKFSFHPKNACGDLNAKSLDANEELRKIVIRREDGSNPSKKIRNELGIMNVHHAALFADPDGVAQFVNNEWEDIAVSHWP